MIFFIKTHVVGILIIEVSWQGASKSTHSVSFYGDIRKQEAHGPRFAHLSESHFDTFNINVYGLHK